VHKRLPKQQTRPTVLDRPRQQRALNANLNAGASYGGWQRGVRVDGRDAVQVTVQERVVDLESSFEEGEAREDTGGTPATTASYLGRQRARRSAPAAATKT
jgi:hypothetical protein